MHRWIMATTLLVSLAPAAFARGLHARIEGPVADGLTYTARAYELEPGDALSPWALAEGVVDGKRQSWLIRLETTEEPGVFQFERQWPREGVWMIRFMLGHPPSPATVATLRADGTVKKNQWYRRSDGSRECSRALRKVAKIDPNDDDC